MQAKAKDEWRGSLAWTLAPDDRDALTAVSDKVKGKMESAKLLSGKHSALAVLVIPELLCVTGSGRGSGAGRDGWHPGVPGEGVADGGEDGDPVLGGGGGVSADGVPVPGGFLRAEPAGDLLLGL